MATKNDILSAVDQVKEYLALNKTQDAIKLMAQVSVAIIENLTDEALIVSKGYEEDLKALGNAGIVNSSTAHNLETLIISGVQANNGVDVPKEYVDKAFEVLNDEIDIIFNKQPKEESFMPVEQEDQTQEKKPIYDELNIEEDEPVFLTENGDKDFRAKEKFRKNKLTKLILQNKRKISKLIAIIIPIIFIIIVAIIIKGCVSGAGEDERYEEVYETPFNVTSEEPTEESTEPETTSVAGTYVVTGDIVWIRDQATTSSKKLEYRNKGDVVNVIGFYDEDWAIISYEGKEAFISRQYIYKQE